MTRTTRTKPRRRRPLVAVALFALVAAPLAATGPLAEAQDTDEGAAPADSLVSLSEEVAPYSAADYTPGSWESFAMAREEATEVIEQADATGAERAEAREELQEAIDDLVMVRGLETLIADYETRAPGEHTADSWAPFAEALTTASDVADDTSATSEAVADAKTDLQTAAAELEPLQGSFETITNDTFWNDTDGNPIYSQGGGVFKFGDTYYWYGVHYQGAESYRADPSRKYNDQVRFVSIPVYSSQDLVNWTFENEIATTSTGLGELGGNMGDAGWIGRLGVSYNENTGKYVLLVQMWHPSHDHGVLFLQGDSPTDDFAYGNFQTRIQNSPTTGTGDQTVFTDEDGRDYLIMSNREGRAHAYVAEISESDSLSVEPAVEVGYSSEGREGNAMFKLDGTYYMAASDLHGWNTSVNYVLESTGGGIQGDYTDWYTMDGTGMDYSHVTQTGFFVTVEGTEQDTVLYAGDRWADFAWNGIGYNQWVPITEEGDELRFHSVSQWEFNAVTGEWRVGSDNNYILNPDFQADRIIVSSVRGWRNIGGWVTNVEGGANSSRFALQVGDGGGVEQRIETLPEGVYTLSLEARGDAGEVVVTDADGVESTLGVPSSGGWTERELTGIELPGGAATVTVRASDSGGFTVDDFSLVRQGGGNGGATVRYEAENPPATCEGTIDANHSGYSGTGFCNTLNSTGTAAQFTVNADGAEETTLEIRFANGSSSARGADVVVNGTAVASTSFQNTGSWATWSTETVTVPLDEGDNTVRLAATGSGGLPNIDYLDA
ncbi:family 43 glycosylhydrolase [Glycomyces xiaoerkulensis]|uniref:family 43 glycosylhydrolase n=1 Tax=Glycomyces xiaoerkulensis TaxID=2038139 RepID=UPI0018E485EF|nr:family 43 glycosylhydrolase [Glycomyces xiaoerkulensis]